MSPTWWIIVALGLVALALLSRVLIMNPREEPEGGLVWGIVRGYSYLFHRLRVRGRGNIPPSRNPGPLIVVANHSSGVDPLLMAAACPFEIRWIMAQDMRHRAGEWVWRWARVIFVNREAPSSAGTREAIQHLKDGGVIGVFPEGGIERPRGHVLPFLPGVGFLIKKTGAPVLPVVLEGTPDVDPAWHALRRRSRSVVTFMPQIDYSGSGLGAAEIAEDLRGRFVGWIEGGEAAAHSLRPKATAETGAVRRETGNVKVAKAAKG